MSDLRIQDKVYPPPSRAPNKSGAGSAGFSDFIKQAISRVNHAEIAADQSIEKLLEGKAGIHETMIALEKADISLRFLLQIRNKAIDAYREIMRMQF